MLHTTEMRSTVHAPTHSAHEPCTVSVFRTVADDALACRVRGEFSEMPGMRLTLEQAMRMWTMNRETCKSLLRSLLATRFLEIDGSGRYRKAHGGY